jgi:TonB family protein
MAGSNPYAIAFHFYWARKSLRYNAGVTIIRFADGLIKKDSAPVDFQGGRDTVYTGMFGLAQHGMIIDGWVSTVVDNNGVTKHCSHDEPMKEGAKDLLGWDTLETNDTLVNGAEPGGVEAPSPPPELPADVLRADAESGAAGLRDLLVALGQGQSHGIRLIPGYSHARLALKHRFAGFGIPFLAPEGYGTQAFHTRYLALLKALLITKTREQARGEDRQPAKNDDSQTNGDTSCTTPNVDATIIGSPVKPDYPALAAGATGVTQVKVKLDSHGRVMEASVYNSSGNHWIDIAAVAAAGQNKFSPEIRNCHATSGSSIVPEEVTGQ